VICRRFRKIDSKSRSKSGKLEFTVENLRFNPNPPPISGGRQFSKSPEEAFYKVEDVLSHFAQGKITIDRAVKSLNYARHAIIPFQNYSQEVLEKLDKLYEEAIKILNKLKTPEKVKEWLLSHGPPRKTHKTLESFFKK